MVTQRVNVEYTNQPYFNKATERPQPLPADNTNAAPGRSNVVAGPWGKAQVAYKSSNAPVRTAPSTDEIFSAGYKKAGLRPSNDNRAPDQTRKAHVSYAAPASVPSVPRTDASRISKVKRKKSVSVTKMARARLRVTSANAWIGSWVVWWYLSFQLPLAVISAAGLGMAYAVYSSYRSNSRRRIYP